MDGSANACCSLPNGIKWNNTSDGDCCELPAGVHPQSPIQSHHSRILVLLTITAGECSVVTTGLSLLVGVVTNEHILVGGWRRELDGNVSSNEVGGV